MLQRFTQVGEYYTMARPPIPPKDKDATGFLDIMIYDEETDKHCRITWEQALKATVAGALTGTTDLVNGPSGAKVPLNTWIQTAEAMNHINKNGFKAGAFEEKDRVIFQTNASGVKKTSTTDVTAIAQLVTDMKADYSKMTATICIARPFIEHAMLSAVLTVSGQDTGATLFGPSDMQVSANTSVKTIEGCVSESASAALFPVCFQCGYLTPFCAHVPTATTRATSSRSSPSRRTCT